MPSKIYLSLILSGLLFLEGLTVALADWSKAPPSGDYKKVSSLVPLPDFIPGLGMLYVVPATLPAGPFLAYDRGGRLLSSIYMIPIKDISAHRDFDDLAVAREKVDHVSIQYNAGHPGVPEPHYHIILWYVSQKKASTLTN